MNRIWQYFSTSLASIAVALGGAMITAQTGWGDHETPVPHR